jgi:hypothetical protein
MHYVYTGNLLMDHKNMLWYILFRCWLFEAARWTLRHFYKLEKKRWCLYTSLCVSFLEDGMQKA